ncbi:MAG: serine hydrolase domain-containing protein [Bacteroidota bacterium]
MKTRLLLFGLLILVFGQCKNRIKKEESNHQYVKHGAKIEKIDSLMQSLVKNKHTLGITFGIQIADNDSFMSAYGWADLEQHKSVEINTKFGLASVTKPFTAVAIAQLAKDGKLTFEDPLTRFFPDFPEGEKVTIYQLLSHTSGINEWWMGGLPKDTPEDWVTGANPHEYVQRMDTLYLFEPGTRYSYSNMGYLLLGEIIEKISGKHYSTYLQEFIFIPLGMLHTGLVSDKETFKDMAKGYGIQEESDAMATRFVASPFIAGSLKSFGGLKSNVGDMLIWSRALFNGQLIDKGTVDKLTTYARVSSHLPVYEVKYIDPKFSPPPPQDFMKKDGYALGFSRTEIYGKQAIWHSGGMPGFNTLWFYFPESDVSLVILSNTDNGIIPAFEEIMKVVTEI